MNDTYIYLRDINFSFMEIALKQQLKFAKIFFLRTKIETGITTLDGKKEKEAVLG